jgi:hypothetical protein
MLDSHTLFPNQVEELVSRFNFLTTELEPLLTLDNMKDNQLLLKRDKGREEKLVEIKDHPL